MVRILGGWIQTAYRSASWRLELQAQPGAGGVRPQGPVTPATGAVEEHVLDAVVVVEDTPGGGTPAGARPGAPVQRRRAMGRQLQPAGLAQRPDAQEAGDAAARVRVGLQDVHGAGVEHAAEVGRS